MNSRWNFCSTCLNVGLLDQIWTAELYFLHRKLNSIKIDVSKKFKRDQIRLYGRIVKISNFIVNRIAQLALNSDFSKYIYKHSKKKEPFSIFPK